MRLAPCLQQQIAVEGDVNRRLAVGNVLGNEGVIGVSPKLEAVEEAVDVDELESLTGDHRELAIHPEEVAQRGIGAAAEYESVMRAHDDEPPVDQVRQQEV